MGKTSIEWTARPGTVGRTWNPVRGCSRVSEGCRNCYAERLAARFSDPERLHEMDGVEGVTTMEEPAGAFHGFATRSPARWTGKVALVPEKIDEPLRWRKPSTVFVNSMSDLFHEGFANEEIAAVFGVMAAAPHHTFIVLTKRAQRMRQWFEWMGARDDGTNGESGFAGDFAMGAAEGMGVTIAVRRTGCWPLPNVWLGVSVEDQATADERIPHLLATPAAVRFCSYEPALGPVQLYAYMKCPGRDRGLRELVRPVGPGLDWVICGGESGPNARPFNVQWARCVLTLTHAVGVPTFVKQMGANVRDRNDRGFLGDEPDEWPDTDPECVEEDPDRTCDHGYQGAEVRIHLRDRKGGDMNEWPADLRVRQFPEVTR